MFCHYFEAELADHVPESDEQWQAAYIAPNKLGHVCRRWRDVARRTPRLWIWIVVQLSAYPSRDWLSRMSSRIVLAGALPLRLLMRGQFPPYDEELVSPAYVSQRQVWDLLLPAVRQCSNLRVYVYPDDAHTLAAYPLMTSEAPMLEDLTVRLTLDQDALPDYWSLADTPNLLLNIRAPDLRRIELAGMFSSYLDPQGLVVYPKVTQAKIETNKDLTAADVQTLLQRFPALEQLEPGAYCSSRGMTLAWFSHPTVRRIVLPSFVVSCMDLGVGPQAFPQLEAADLGPLGRTYLTTLFAAPGALHAIRFLALDVGYYNDELVGHIDLLPRLESARLRGGVLTRSFAVERVWVRGQAWRSPMLQRLTLENVKEIQPVDPGAIVSWLRARNSTARDGAHAALRTFRIGWQSRPKSFTQQFEHDIEKALCL